MSAKAVKAVKDARDLAEEMHADGSYRAAEIIRRVCRSNDGYRVTMSQLHGDNMELRDVVERQAKRIAQLESTEAQ